MISKNNKIISESIGGSNTEILISILNVLNPIRNDIAHSRYISEDQFRYIELLFNQILTIIPNFKSLFSVSFTEENLGILFHNIFESIDKIENKPMIEIEEIHDILKMIEKCLNSFWLNSIFISLYPDIQRLKTSIDLYYQFRKTPGGLLKINDWKKENSQLFINIKTIIIEQ